MKEYYDTALEAQEELQVLIPQVELYAADSNVESSLKNAKEMLQKAEAQLPAAKRTFCHANQ